MTDNIGQIVEMKEEHLREVVTLEEECGLSLWHIDGYRKEIKEENSVCLVSLSERKVTGFIVIGLVSHDEAEIFNFAVDGNHRQRGIGTKLFKQAIAKTVEKTNLVSIWLEVRSSNITAIEFYEKNEFSIVGDRRNYYFNPTEDALVMKLDNSRNINKQSHSTI